MEFSSQVAQYWSVAALRQHVDNAFAVLADDGTLVVSGIPWSRMRRAYAWGDLTGGPRRSAPVAGLNYLGSSGLLLLVDPNVDSPALRASDAHDVPFGGTGARPTVYVRTRRLQPVVT